MYLHVRGDRPFSLTNKFNLFDVIGWRACLCLVSFFSVGIANHVVANKNYFESQDRQGIVDDSPYRKVYDLFDGIFRGREEINDMGIDETQRESWKFVPDRIRILYGNDFGRVREC